MSRPPSGTALAAAAGRAAHLIVDGVPTIFEDTVALALLGPDAEELIAVHRSSVDQEFSAGVRLILTARSRYVENRLADAVRRGVDQYVVLGAGLDSFAYRSPLARHGRVFEVDHPDTQAGKRQRLAHAGVAVPAQVEFVAVDFENDPLRERLTGAGFDVSKPSFVSWLGVTPYLTHEAVTATFAALGALAAGTEVTAEYVLPTDLRDGGGRRLADQVIPAAAALGEPWLTFFSPAEMAALLASCGFAVVEQVGQREQVDTMFWERSDGLHPIELTRLARAVVRVVGQPTEAIDQWGNRPS